MAQTIRVRVVSKEVRVTIPQGRRGLPGNVQEWFDALPEYTDDAAAVTAGYTGSYYFTAPGSDVLPAGVLMKRQDI